MNREYEIIATLKELLINLDNKLDDNCYSDNGDDIIELAKEVNDTSIHIKKYLYELEELG